MASLANKPLQHLRQVAASIEPIIINHLPGAALMVFGSVASGNVDERSDIDLLVLHDTLPNLRERHALTGQIGGEWRFGSGGDDLLFPVVDEGEGVQGVSVTLHYQRTKWVGLVLEQVMGDGAVTTTLMPFRPYTLAGLLQRSWVLKDDKGWVTQWRKRLDVFPDTLKLNLLLHFIPILEEQLAELLANAERQLGPRGVLFNLNWAVDALIGILYAINDVYDPADRRAERTIWPHLRRAPRNLSQRLEKILNGPFDDVNALVAARQFQELALEVLIEAERLIS